MATIGQRNQRITLQQDLGQTSATDGTHVEDWQTIGYAWVSIEPLTGRDLWLRELTHRVTFEYLDAQPLMVPGSSCRIISDGQIFLLDPPRDLRSEHRVVEMLARQIFSLTSAAN